MLDRLRDAARAVADLPSTPLQADPAAGRSASWTTARGAGAPSTPGGTPSCSIPPSPVSNSDVGAGGRRSQAMQRAGAVAPRVRADRRGQKTIELFRAGFTRFRLSRFGIRFSPKCLHCRERSRSCQDGTGFPEAVTDQGLVHRVGQLRGGLSDGCSFLHRAIRLT
jgi:hypothetical protein